MSTIKSLTLVAVLFCVAALGNSLITFVLWDNGGEFINCFFWGMLIAQPCVLSIWCPTVKQRLISRVSLSMGILFVLYCLYFLTLRGMDDFGELPLEVPIVCFGIVAVLSLMIQIPLWLLLRYTNTALSIGKREPTSTSDNQFGIKHLLIATAIAALLIVLAHAVFANLAFEGGAPWVEIMTFMVSLAVLTSTICLLSFGLVFLNRIRVAAGIALVLVVFLGSAGVYLILSNVGNFPDDLLDVFYNTLGYALALGGTINAVLISFYAIGYRLENRLNGD